MLTGLKSETAHRFRDYRRDIKEQFKIVNEFREQMKEFQTTINSHVDRRSANDRKN